MKLKTKMNFKDSEIEWRDCSVDKIIEVSNEDFYELLNHTLQDKKYIADNAESMYVDKDDVYHCLLVLGEEHNDGVLIESEGADYARYSAFIPNARELVLLDKYPSAKEYIEKMDDVIEKILTDAKNDETVTFDNPFELRSWEYSNTDNDFSINTFLLKNMLIDSGEIEAIESTGDYIYFTIKQKYDETFNKKQLTQEDVDVICVKHELWLYGIPDGEQADFSNTVLYDLDFEKRNLCSAIINNSMVHNCNFNNSSLCFINCNNSDFRGCNMEHTTAEESDIKSTYFNECNLRNSHLRHSNLTNTEFKNCNLDYSDQGACCVENTIYENCNKVDMKKDNQYIYEQDWIDDTDDMKTDDCDICLNQSML